MKVRWVVVALVGLLALALPLASGCGGGGASGVVGTWLDEGTNMPLNLNADGTWSTPTSDPPGSGTYKVNGNTVTFYAPDGQLSFEMTLNSDELVYTAAGLPADTYKKQK